LGQNRILLGIPEGKKPCGRPKCRWEGTVETYLKEIGMEGVAEA
jgi:hypothetical protein